MTNKYVGAAQFVKNLITGGKKSITPGGAINKVPTNIPKTEIQKKIRDLKIGNQALKGSGAKLNQTIFEIKNKKPITFKKDKGKTESNTEKAKKEGKKDGGRMGLKFGGGADMGSKKLSPKQMKIASLAGNKKKIDKPDFKKLRTMKSPMDKQVRQKAAFGGGADMGKVASDKTKAEVKKYEKRAKDASKFLKNKDRSFGSIMREKYMR